MNDDADDNDETFRKTNTDNKYMYCLASGMGATKSYPFNSQYGWMDD